LGYTLNLDSEVSFVLKVIPSTIVIDSLIFGLNNSSTVPDGHFTTIFVILVFVPSPKY